MKNSLQATPNSQQANNGWREIRAGAGARTSAQHAGSLGSALFVASAVALALLLVLSVTRPLLQPTPSTAQTEPAFPPTGQWFTYANGDDILALATDEAGTLWAGTRAGGLVRWDTSTGAFTQFLRPQDGLAGNIVYDIAIDADGFLWLATDHGLSVLDDHGTPDKADDAWHTYTRQNSGGQLPSDHVTAVAVDEAGRLWIGASQYWDAGTEAYAGGGLTWLDPHGTVEPADDVWLNTFTLADTRTVDDGDVILGLASDNIADILPVSENRVWIATRQHWLFEDPDENIPGRWVLAHGGLSRLEHAGTPDPADDAWHTWNCEDDAQIGCVVTQLKLDPTDTVWAAMRGRGVLTFSPDAASLRPDRDRFTTADGLPSNFVDAIAFGPSEDADWADTVWFSTYHSFSGQGHGVAVLDHNGTLRDRSDDAWNTKNPTAGQPLTTAAGLAGDRVQAMVADTETVWMGTGGLAGEAYGVSPFDLAQGAVDKALATAGAGIASNYITAIAFGGAGSRWEDHVWAASGNRWERRYGEGALLLDHQGTLDAGDDVWAQFTQQSTDDDGGAPWAGLAGDNVVALTVEGDNVWLGAREAMWDAEEATYTDGGLSVYDGEGWAARTTENSSLRADSVTALAVGCEGELWIGLGSLQNNAGAGIDRLDTAGQPHNLENDAWQSPLRYPALPSDLITGMAPDCSRNRLWVSGAPHFTEFGSRGGGVGRYDYASEGWTTYTTDDGLQSYTTDTVTGDARSIAVSADGAIWVGAWGITSTSGISLIDDWPYVPAVVNRYRSEAWSAQVFERAGWTAAVAVDSDGTVWAGASRGGMDRDQDGQEEDLEIKKGAGGIRLTRDGAEWVDWSPPNAPLPSDDIEVIAVAPDGDVWVGASGWGLMRFHPGEEPAQPTPTGTPATPGPTDTPTPTGTAGTPTPTDTAGTPTPTRTPAEGAQRQVYLPLVARNWQSRMAAATATPTPTAGVPQFTCSGWCEPGSDPDSRRQTVTADRAVDDWRVYLNSMGPFGVIFEEKAPARVVLDAPLGYEVRIEAFYQGQWILACDSIVACQAQP